ncbi:MAG TPA: hypothetical protein VF365_02610 [Candidatus Limnocylindria bacterium]
MSVIDRIRAAWSSATRSRGRTAVAAAGAIGALAVGVGFSLAVNALRGEDLGQAAAATTDVTVEASASAADATPTPEPTATALATPTEPTPTPTPTPTLTPSPTATAVATAVPTPQPLSTAPSTAGCDEITIDDAGIVSVNGVRADDPWEDTYGEQMPMAILRVAARADGASGVTSCLEVDLPGIVVTGNLEICGDVVTQRLEPLPTPAPSEPGPTMPPRYGEPTISGVTISDRMLDVNSYPLLEVADVVDVPVCLEIASDSNDVYLNLSMAICETVLLADDGTLTVTVGGGDWSFTPEYVFDDEELLPIGQTVEAGLIIRNDRDDVIHLIELAVWTTPDCP